MIEQGLQNYCYISHIAINYRGDDRPKQGFERRLEQLSFLEQFTDDQQKACVRMREPNLSGGAPRGQVNTIEAPREDLRVSLAIHEEIVGERSSPPMSPRSGQRNQERTIHWKALEWKS